MVFEVVQMYEYPNHSTYQYSKVDYKVHRTKK